LIALRGADGFTLDGAPYTRLVFERDASGKVVALVVRQVSGAVTRFPRSSSPLREGPGSR
jgi:hypothetical protein